jgi:hypothetical protein
MDWILALTSKIEENYPVFLGRNTQVIPLTKGPETPLIQTPNNAR